MTAASVPEKDRKLLVRNQLTEGGNRRELRTVFTDDATAEISEAIWRQAVEAAAALNVTLAGVDIITVDPTVPLEASNGAIIEVNTTPGLHHHYHNGKWLGRTPTHTILEYLLK